MQKIDRCKDRLIDMEKINRQNNEAQRWKKYKKTKGIFIFSFFLF